MEIGSATTLEASRRRSGPAHADSAGPPVGRTSFIGRSLDIERVGQLIGQSRLVTLTGPGGIGKTRLAIESARHSARRFPGGVVFVELAAVRDPELMLPTIAAVLGIGATEASSAVKAVSDRLGPEETLLVLDNFEQIPTAAVAVSELITANPTLRIAVTSRMPLHVAGEQEYPVPPLGLVDPELRATNAAIGEVESVALFVARAQAVRPEFAVTETNAAILAEICDRLDGLPLAIELAAARTKLLSPEALLHRLESRLPALAEGPTDAPARQRTLRETIAWSYELLVPLDRLIFDRLGVFVGGFSLAAGEAVVLERPAAAGVDLLEIIGHLVDHSLVQVDDRIAAEPRFAMLETIREFVLDQITAAEAEALQDRHLTHFLSVAEAEEAQERGVDQAAWVRRLAADRDNFRAALVHAQERRDAERLLRLAAALERRFWLASGDHDLGESRHWLEAGLKMGGAAPPSLRAKALLKMAWTVEDSPARVVAVIKESLAEYERAGDEAGMTDALAGLGHVAILVGDFPLADDSLHRGLALARRIDIRPQILVEVLVPLGLLAHLRRQYALAGAYLDEALDVARRAGDAWGTAFALEHLGRLALSEGDVERAQATLSESVELARTVGDAEQYAETALFLITARISAGALEGARSLIRDVARTAHDLNSWHQCLTLEATAEWLDAAGAYAAAVRCLASADRTRADLDQTIDTDWEAARRRLLERLRRDVPRVDFEAAWTTGQALRLVDALERGLRAMEAVDLTAPLESSRSPGGRYDLSRRELEVLALVADGRSDGEIAERLFISKKTASVHVAHIKDKLGAESRVEVAMAGIRLGLVNLSSDDPGSASSP